MTIPNLLYYGDNLDVLRRYVDTAGSSTKQIVLSVKAGHLLAQHVRDLRGVMEREKAEIGILLSLEDPTKQMRAEAASAGVYSSPWGTKHPRLQLRTVGELLEGKGIDYPRSNANVTFKKAPRVGEAHMQIPLLAHVAEDPALDEPKKPKRKS